jgi:membrane protein YqaA with SNARE-associated domain
LKNLKVYINTQKNERLDQEESIHLIGIEKGITNSKKITIARILVLALVILVSVGIFLLSDKIENLAYWGYPGIFLLSFFSYATVLLPAPGIAIVFALAGALNPLLLGIIAGAGAALGETVGYMAGFSSQAILENRRQYKNVVKWMQRNAPVTIFLLSAIPNPFFDLAGISAGAFRIPVKIFLFYCWIGETVKMIFFAYLGAYSLDFFKQFLNIG